MIPRCALPGMSSLSLRQHVGLVHVPSWSSYGEFLALACILVLIPGPDFAVVVKNTLMAGQRRGW